LKALNEKQGVDMAIVFENNKQALLFNFNEAVEIYRKMIEAQPDSFTGTLKNKIFLPKSIVEIEVFVE
jgi:hypothetical protein